MTQLKLATTVLSLAVATLFASSAFAGDASTSLSVSASVSNNCIISTADVAFGAYDPIVANASSPLDGTGTVAITCTIDAGAVLTLGQGLNDGGGTAENPERRMVDGTNFLEYALFTDLVRSDEWGNTAGTGVADTGTGFSNGHLVYGRINAAQNVPQGNYVDTVVATVTF